MAKDNNNVSDRIRPEDSITETDAEKKARLENEAKRIEEAKQANILAGKKAKEKAKANAKAKKDKEASRIKAEKEDEPTDVEEKDYLRKYQVRKQTAPGSVESDPQKGSKAEIMKKALLEQPRVRMLIPRSQGEHKSIAQSVNLNGYRLDFPKNAYVDVPRQVAEVLGESLEQTDIALQHNIIGGDKQREEALL